MVQGDSQPNQQGGAPETSPVGVGCAENDRTEGEGQKQLDPESLRRLQGAVQ